MEQVMNQTMKETNELNKNARGGTELMMEGLESNVDPDLLSKFQIIQSRVRDIDPDRKSIYWLHDLHNDPEVQHLRDGGWNKFDKLVFVSHWQQQMYNAYLGVPFDAGVVLKNAIDPVEKHFKPNDGVIRLVYFSTPHRGLELLYHVFDNLCDTFDNIELNVFSSFELYGWGARDEQFKDLFALLEQHPKINYNKSIPNEKMREVLKDQDILAYPSTWPETSCLVLIESMSAGLNCVHSSLGALPETSAGLTTMYNFTEDNLEHAYRLRDMLYRSIIIKMDSQDVLGKHLNATKAIIDSQYGWDNRGKEWTGLLEGLT